MERKTDVVKRYVQSGEYKKALALVKGFRFCITKEQHDVMLRAYECMIHPTFYQSIGIDLNKAVDDGITVLKTIYG